MSPMPYLQGQAAQGPTKNIVATHPLQLSTLTICVWNLGKILEENILVVTDHFTQCTQAYVTQSQTTQTTAKTLWDKFIVLYRLPEKILSDQARYFQSQLVADLWVLMRTQKWASPYHAQTNDKCERFNFTPIGMLEMLPPEKKSDWKNHIGELVHAYNCIWNSATGFTPYYLMYRRQPCLPVDVTLGLALHSVMAPTTSKFVQKMWECVKWAHKKAKSFQEREAQCHKLTYDQRSKAAALEVGDTVPSPCNCLQGPP